ncbi:MAG: dihydrofolate reductase [Anaerolineaceae bacterium]|nr:dihydrofolate reductase [Anaerolineaceae bacterium]
MTRCSVFIATSLDGYIARPDGKIDWLDEANALIPAGEDCGYGAFISTVDAIVMGRKTFEQVLTFGEWPYGEMPVIVMSRQLRALPEGVPQTVSLSHEEPRVLIEQLAQRGLQQLYVDGGRTIQSFLAEGLIDDLTITLIPVVLGSGLPLFGPMANDLHLQLTYSRTYDFGLVQLTYRVLK